MMDSLNFRQAELLLRVLSLVDREVVFALKGGTAINFFVRDFPRLSVDIDLVYPPIAEREVSLRELSAALVGSPMRWKPGSPGRRSPPSGSKGPTFGAAVRFAAVRRPSRSSRTWSCAARSSPGTPDPHPQGPERL